MGKGQFVGAGYDIGRMLVGGEYYSSMMDKIVGSGYSPSKLGEHLRWMLKHGYKFVTDKNVSLCTHAEMARSDGKIICKDALDRGVATKSVANAVERNLYSEIFGDANSGVKRAVPNARALEPGIDIEKDESCNIDCDSLLEKLVDFWKSVLPCRECKLPKGCIPQVRTVGENYKFGGILFLQINPGNIGSTDEEELCSRYINNPHWLEKARAKRAGGIKIFELQSSFSAMKNVQSFVALNNEIKHQMRTLWGRERGQFSSTIEQHGVRFEDVCVLNLAQCAAPKDNYTRKMISTCYSRHTSRLLKILRPKYVVAQGSQVFDFMKSAVKDRSFSIIQGVHQSSRASNADKALILQNARDLLKL